MLVALRPVRTVSAMLRFARHRMAVLPMPPVPVGVLSIEVYARTMEVAYLQ